MTIKTPRTKIKDFIQSKKILIGISISIFFLVPTVAKADGGMVSWPPEVQVRQSAQNAIVAWNGKEEVLILSNDISGENAIPRRAGVIAVPSEKEKNFEFTTATILRMVPLPSRPSKIQAGEFESFLDLTEIVNKKGRIVRGNLITEGAKTLGPGRRLSGVEVTFHKKIGAHDITVVKVRDLDDFVAWIEDFTIDKNLEEKKITSEFKNGISDYLSQDIKYFVFDVIEKTKPQQSIKPLVYRFESDYLYYPLKITAISEVGQSQAKINIFLILNGIVEESLLKKVGLLAVNDFDYYIGLNKKELKRISPQIEDLFHSRAFVSLASYKGALEGLDEDLIIYNRDLHLPTAVERAYHFLQFILLSLKRFVGPFSRYLFLINFIFFLLYPVGFLFVFFLLAGFIKKQLKKKGTKPIVRNLIAYAASALFSVLLFYSLGFMISSMELISEFYFQIGLILIVIFAIVKFLVRKLGRKDR